MTFAYNPAGQIVSRDASNNSYAATGFANQNVADTHDGLNRLTASGGATITHDANGNIASDGTRTYGYSSENRLTSVGGAGAYSYDPLGRLAATPAGYLAVHDGDRMTEEYNTGGARSAVYVPGPAMDEALASIGYLGDRYYLITDERGSVLNHVNESGVQWGTFKYDEYGMIMQAGGRWYSYTGQLHLPESGLLYYKARMYHPGLGRFLQPDPIWPMSGMNGYPYVNGDPINLSDPSGLSPDPERCHLPGEEPCEGGKGEEMVVNAILGPRFAALRFSGGSGSGYGGGGGGGGGSGGQPSRDSRCIADQSGAVHVAGSVTQATLAIGAGRVVGTVTNLNSGRSARFTTAAFSSGLAIGQINFSASFRDFSSFAGGWDFAAGYISWLGLSTTSSARDFSGNRVGEIDINLSPLSVPVGLLAVQVDPVRNVPCGEE